MITNKPFLNFLIAVILAMTGKAYAQNCPGTIIIYSSTGDNYFCSGQTVTYYTDYSEQGTASYNWSVIGGQITSNYGSSIDVLWSGATGSLSVYVTDQLCQPYCEPICSVGSDIFYTAEMEIPAAYPLGATAVCAGTVALVSGTNLTNVSYQWKRNGSPISGATTSSYTASQTGSYTVSISRDGCSKESSPAISVTVDAMPSAPSIISQSSTELVPGAVRLTAGNGTNYLWVRNGVNMEGETNPVFVATLPGNYAVKNVNGVCFSTSSSVSVTGNNNNFNVANVIQQPGITTESQLFNLGLQSNQITQAVQYMDDLGKTSLSIATKNSALTPSSQTRRDIVQPFVYDELGRTARSYLPYASTQGTGMFISESTVISAQLGFYNNATDKIKDDGAPFAEVAFESSPVGRIIQQGKVGSAYQLGTNGDEKIAYNIDGPNHIGTIRRWTINGSLPTSSSPWPSDVLKVVTKTNEQGIQSQVISQGDGLKLVERREVSTGVTAETYYVYDANNNLRFILPPELMRIIQNGSFRNPTQAEINTWAFQMVYDAENRLIEAKSPGADWSYSIYDKLGRLVLSQDGKQRLANEWSYTKFDIWNRPIISGVYRPGGAVSRATMQSNVDALNSNQGFENLTSQTVNGVRIGVDIVIKNYENINEYKAVNSIVIKPGFSFTAGTTASSFRASIDDGSGSGVSADVFPKSNDEAHVVTVYDTYDDCGICQDASYQFVNESWSSISNEPYQKFNRIKGKIAATSVKVINSNTWLHTVSYYNRNLTGIQSITSNHIGGRTRGSSLFDFSGKIIETVSSYSGLNTSLSTVRKRFEFDHAGRLLKVHHRVNSQPEVVLTSNEYTELGQLVDKKIHSVNSEPYLQSIDLRYNIQGTTLSVNSPSQPDATDPAYDYFSFDLGYENTFGSLNTPRYDGLLSGIRWKQDISAKERGYAYSYNNLGWLSASTFKQNNNNNWTSSENGFFNEDGISYDYNGNIQALTRKKQITAINAPVIDQLQYYYGTSGGNQLFSVTDNAPAAEKAKGFNDGNTSGDDYVYDINGNLTQDKNKNITVSYNFYNLPDRVTFADNSCVRYTYDATKRKLRQEYCTSCNTNLQVVFKTDYVDDLIFVNDQLQLAMHEEGRIIQPDFKNLVANKEVNGLEGYNANGNVTITSEFLNGENYAKAVCNQSIGTPGVWPIGGTYSVKPNESYSFKVLGYQAIGTTASLYVWSNNGDLIWAGPTLPAGAANENWVTSTFTIPSGVTQIKIGVLWNGAAAGNTFYINRVSLYKTDFEYQYYLADNVGSPRVVLQTTPATVTLTATMETENHAKENELFLNLQSSFYEINSLGGTAPLGNEALRMSSANRIGPTRDFKVFPGDVINASVQAFYSVSSGYTDASSTTIANALALIMSGGNVIIDNAINQAYTSGGSNLLLSPGQGADKPAAFLNYILFDEKYVPLKAKSFPIQNNPGTKHTVQFDQNLVVEEAGILFVYLSYDNENTFPVYFDDFKITFNESPVIQINSYYPYGLLANSWSREGEVENKYFYQGKELDAQTGWQDFQARQYDGSIGRWIASDPKGNLMPYNSVYASMMNNPTFVVDPDGECPICIPIIMGAVIGAGVSGAQALVYNQSAWNVLKGALIGAVAGAASFGAGQFVAANVGTVGFVGSGLTSASSAFAGGFVNGSLTAWGNGGSFKSGLNAGLKEGGMAAAIAGIQRGLSGGIKALRHGGKFWSGKGATMASYATGDPIAGEPVTYSTEEAVIRSEKYYKSLSYYNKVTQFADGSNGAPEWYRDAGDGYFVQINGKDVGKKALAYFKWLGYGKGGEIYYAKASFASERQLYLTMGHEYIHAGYSLSPYQQEWGNLSSEIEHGSIAKWEEQVSRRWGNWTPDSNTKTYLKHYDAKYDHKKFFNIPIPWID